MGLVDYLLELLGSPLASVQQPAAVKAELVAALNAMASNAALGAQARSAAIESRVTIPSAAGAAEARRVARVEGVPRPKARPLPGDGARDARHHGYVIA